MLIICRLLHTQLWCNSCTAHGHILCIVSRQSALQVLECIAPGSDDIVLPKTSSNVFSSTNVDYILRSLEKRYLILAGCVTDQCVESAVREACDRHYYVTLVTGEADQSQLMKWGPVPGSTWALSVIFSRSWSIKHGAVPDPRALEDVCVVSKNRSVYSSCVKAAHTGGACRRRHTTDRSTCASVQMHARPSLRSGMTIHCEPSTDSAGSARLQS